MRGFLLTDRAGLDLDDIESYTEDRWGPAQTTAYLVDLRSAFEQIVESPDLGLSRMHRSAPFRMVREQSHFIVYDLYGDWIVIAAVPHARADIEGLVRDMTPDYRRELETLRAQFPELDADGNILGRD
ncbi:type II toxin-antitoxin system RelE/ParE family toxin [Minwuia sp.]|uniref:type II toxin-antitoxin system RelE/ParE family toxin n=1 Tax=Minwuia sp. TaxID=2493630 RepID=UPI003A92FB72